MTGEDAARKVERQAKERMTFVGNLFPVPLGLYWIY